MCIICLEFNRRQDIGDARKMIEAARRESNAISEKHLEAIEDQLDRMAAPSTLPELPD